MKKTYLGPFAEKHKISDITDVLSASGETANPDGKPNLAPDFDFEDGGEL